MKIAIDAMGGDHAPAALVAGGFEAARLSGGRIELVFVGDEQCIKEEIERQKKNIGQARYSIVHASQVIEMGESPGEALKKKPDSSILVAHKLQKSGDVQATVSAGHTGAAMASALFVLRRIPGVHRPAIGSFIPSGDGVTLLIDVGANVDPKPKNLLQFAAMGAMFMSKMMGKESPKIGLLSIGEERGKGNMLVKETYGLLEQSNMNFIGNVEGRDILLGEADVVVCDGFVGNILLKFAESLIKVFGGHLKAAIRERVLSQAGALLMKPAFDSVRKTWDYEEYGGVPLLGVNGVSIIAHGRSTPKAIANAIREAAQTVEFGVNESIRKELELLRGMEIVTE